MKQTLEQKYLDLSVKLEQAEVDKSILQDDVRELVEFPRFYVERFEWAMKELGFDKPDPAYMGKLWCDIYEQAREVLSKHQPTAKTRG